MALTIQEELKLLRSSVSTLLNSLDRKDVYLEVSKQMKITNTTIAEYKAGVDKCNANIKMAVDNVEHVLGMHPKDESERPLIIEVFTKGAVGIEPHRKLDRNGKLNGKDLDQPISLKFMPASDSRKPNPMETSMLFWLSQNDMFYKTGVDNITKTMQSWFDDRCLFSQNYHGDKKDIEITQLDREYLTFVIKLPARPHSSYEIGVGGGSGGWRCYCIMATNEMGI